MIWPDRAAITPSSTSPSPSPASVASRAFRQSRSQRRSSGVAISLDLANRMNMSRHIRKRAGEMSMRTLWFETALVDDQWADRVRLEISGGLISAVWTDVAAERGDERHAIG